MDAEHDRILLEGMQLFGYHGTLAPENELGQRFVVDVDMRCDLRAAGETDDLSQTVDYSEVYAQVRAIVEGPALKLTEAVAAWSGATTLQPWEGLPVAYPGHVDVVYDTVGSPLTVGSLPTSMTASASETALSRSAAARRAISVVSTGTNEVVVRPTRESVRRSLISVCMRRAPSTANSMY